MPIQKSAGRSLQVAIARLKLGEDGVGDFSQFIRLLFVVLVVFVAHVVAAFGEHHRFAQCHLRHRQLLATGQSFAFGDVEWLE